MIVLTALKHYDMVIGESITFPAYRIEPGESIFFNFPSPVLNQPPLQLSLNNTTESLLPINVIRPFILETGIDQPMKLIFVASDHQGRFPQADNWNPDAEGLIRFRHFMGSSMSARHLFSISSKRKQILYWDY